MAATAMIETVVEIIVGSIGVYAAWSVTSHLTERLKLPIVSQGSVCLLAALTDASLLSESSFNSLILAIVVGGLTGLMHLPVVYRIGRHMLLVITTFAHLILIGWWTVLPEISGGSGGKLLSSSLVPVDALVVLVFLLVFQLMYELLFVRDRRNDRLWGLLRMHGLQAGAFGVPALFHFVVAFALYGMVLAATGVFISRFLGTLSYSMFSLPWAFTVLLVVLISGGRVLKALGVSILFGSSSVLFRQLFPASQVTSNLIEIAFPIIIFTYLRIRRRVDVSSFMIPEKIREEAQISVGAIPFTNQEYGASARYFTDRVRVLRLFDQLVGPQRIGRGIYLWLIEGRQGIGKSTLASLFELKLTNMTPLIRGASIRVHSDFAKGETRSFGGMCFMFQEKLLDELQDAISHSLATGNFPTSWLLFTRTPLIIQSKILRWLSRWKLGTINVSRSIGFRLKAIEYVSHSRVMDLLNLNLSILRGIIRKFVVVIDEVDPGNREDLLWLHQFLRDTHAYFLRNEKARLNEAKDGVLPELIIVVFLPDSYQSLLANLVRLEPDLRTTLTAFPASEAEEYLKRKREETGWATDEEFVERLMVMSGGVPRLFHSIGYAACLVSDEQREDQRVKGKHLDEAFSKNIAIDENRTKHLRRVVSETLISTFGFDHRRFEKGTEARIVSAFSWVESATQGPILLEFSKANWSSRVRKLLKMSNNRAFTAGFNRVWDALIDAGIMVSCESAKEKYKFAAESLRLCLRDFFD